MSGLSLFQQAELFYYQGRINDAFENYRKSIKKILKDENVLAKVPGADIIPDDFPQELLGMVWRNFVGFYRDPKMNFTEESHPEAFRLLNSFRPTAKPHPRLERSARGKVLLKGMQITAGLTLGLLAWDKHDRATAAKRYREALDLAETLPAFTSPPPGTRGMEKYVYGDLQDTKTNLGRLILNDTINAELFGAQTSAGQVPGRRDVADLPVPQVRIDKTGAVTAEPSMAFATTACANCGKRDVKLLRCSSCKTTQYCNGECQRAHWPDHKRTCLGRSSKS
ncbi:putative MYND finger [Lyophyllum shimeji]|uniref:MYND finger n=1 Tax=Lyophyllum shimeji TaxID=47721 RepID=A0A9P3UNY2_LYOSH|nr:putative MYND finger [Lyophyllum shimeji]